jgi:hypothetical protein
MSKLQLKKVSYKAAWWSGPRQVTGYAVKSPTGIRYCVRKRDCDYESWTADDFDSGASLFSRVGYHATRSSLIDEVEKQLPPLIRKGTYARHQRLFLETLRSKEEFKGAME